MNPQQQYNPQPTQTPGQTAPAAPPPAPSPQQARPGLAAVPPPTGRFSKFTGFFGRHGKVLSIVAIAVVGTIATFASFAATPNSANNSVAYGFWWTYRFQENYWDGQIHTSKSYCMTHGTVCHGNGSLVFLGGTNQAWQSNPAHNSKPGTILSSPTWYGPYAYSPGPYYVTVGTSITGSQEACFQVRDVTTGNASASVVFMVHNAAVNNGYINQPSQVVASVEGQLAGSFKKGFKPVCLPYYNAHDAYAQEYVIYVRSGTIQTNYVDHLVQANYYNPYIYSYYNAVPGLSAAASKSQTSCSGNIAKSTTTCYSQKDLNAANPSKTLLNVNTSAPATADLE